MNPSLLTFPVISQIPGGGVSWGRALTLPAEGRSAGCARGRSAPGEVRRGPWATPALLPRCVHRLGPQGQLLSGSRGGGTKPELLTEVFFGVQAAAFLAPYEIPAALCGCYNSCSYLCSASLSRCSLYPSGSSLSVFMLTAPLVSQAAGCVLGPPFVFPSSWPFKRQRCFSSFCL